MLTNVSRMYKVGMYGISVDISIEKGYSTVTVWGSDNDLLMSFDSTESAKEICSAVLKVLEQQDNEVNS